MTTTIVTNSYSSKLNKEDSKILLTVEDSKLRIHNNNTDILILSLDDELVIQSTNKEKQLAIREADFNSITLKNI